MNQLRPVPLESEAGFRVLFECATIGILVVNEKGNIELSNSCAEKLFGYDPAALIGKPVEELIPENLRAKHTHHRGNYFKRPKARPMGMGMELFARKKTGEVFPVEISLGYYELEGERLVVAFITDITDQVQARKIVTEREALFRGMADDSPVMIWVAGPDKGCTYFNKTWLEFTGRSLDRELGNGWLENVYADDVATCLYIYSRAFDAHLPFVMEYRLRRYDGEYRWVQDSGKPTFSAENVFTGFIGSCTDVHDQRMTKEALELQVKQRTTALYEALEREKEMSELKSRFVSIASHEFRTPLSIVLSSVSLIEQYEGVGCDEKIKKHLMKIKSSVNNLTTILNDFLSLDKLEQGNVEIEYETFDIHEFISEVIEGVLNKRGQRINHAHQGDPYVTLDRKKLRYVMTNLVSNAVKYSAENSLIYIRSQNEEDTITILVEDHGIGIPEEEQPYLFGKFFRATNTKNVQGTGLGLTIVKRYVELMGGKINFTSKLNEGTIFSISIPPG